MFARVSDRVCARLASGNDVTNRWIFAPAATGNDLFFDFSAHIHSFHDLRTGTYDPNTPRTASQQPAGLHSNARIAGTRDAAVAGTWPDRELFVLQGQAYETDLQTTL